MPHRFVQSMWVLYVAGHVARGKIGDGFLSNVFLCFLVVYVRALF